MKHCAEREGLRREATEALYAVVDITKQQIDVLSATIKQISLRSIRG
jgi:hypothetical protein